MAILIRNAIILVLLVGCGTSSSTTTYRGMMARLTPAPWQQPGTWDFHIIDPEEQSMGHIVLRLTGAPVDNPVCAEGDWYRALLLEESVDYDFGFDLRPAYRVHGQWLTVDLTSSICNADHLLNGEMDDDGASGFFNYAHRLGGNNLGKFTATPVSD